MDSQPLSRQVFMNEFGALSIGQYFYFDTTHISPNIYRIETIRKIGTDFIITGAPACPHNNDIRNQAIGSTVGKDDSFSIYVLTPEGVAEHQVHEKWLGSV